MSNLWRRCIFGCDVTVTRDVPHHSFPNPDKRPELYRAWVAVVGDKLKDSDPKKIYKYRRICDHHFDSASKTTGGRLIWCAVPTIHLKGLQPSFASFVEADHNYCRSRREPMCYEVPSQETGLIVLDEHHHTDSPSEPAPPQFSWQETNLISLDEPHTDKEISYISQAEDVREVRSNLLVSDGLKHNISTAATDCACNECQENITGYTCVQCDDYDLCAACEQKLVHPQHYMLRVPGPRPRREINIIIGTIRRKLKSLEDELNNDGIACVDWNFEIKKEEDPFEEQITETIFDHLENANPVISDHCEVPDVTNQLNMVEQNDGHTSCSESEQSDNSEFLPDKKETSEQAGTDDPESIEWLDESLLDINDDIDKDCRNKQQTQIYFLDDTDLHKIVTSEDENTKQNKILTKHKAVEENTNIYEEATKLNLTKNAPTFKETDILKVKVKRKPVESFGHRAKNINSNIELSPSNKEILHHAPKRKVNVCLDEDYISDANGMSELSKATSKSIGNSSKVNKDTKVAGKRFKSLRLDTGQRNESQTLPDSDVRQTSTPMNKMNLLKIAVVKLVKIDHR